MNSSSMQEYNAYHERIYNSFKHIIQAMLFRGMDCEVFMWAWIRKWYLPTLIPKDLYKELSEVRHE